MREILYRGKTIGFKDSKWVYGDLITTDPYRIVDLANGNDSYVFEKTVGQYTGKADKSEAKLFGGDKFWDNDYEQEFTVEWDEEMLAWMAVNDNCGSEFLSDIWNENCVIIGNIHDSPDLLKGEDAK